MSNFIRKYILGAPEVSAAVPREPSMHPAAGPSSDIHTESLDNSIPYSPSPADVGEVRALLKSTHPALPTEIADIILNFADYSVKDVVTFNPSDVYRLSSRGPGVCGLILKGPQIRELKQYGLELRDLRLKSVRFEIASHDQGWGGEPGTQGTYNSAFSWFEVTILRRLDHSSDWVEPTLTLGSDQRYESYIDYSNAYRRSGWDFATDDNGEMLIWPLQKNKVARRETQTREIVWMLDDNSEGQQQAEPAEDSGNGPGRGFVRTLRSGDVICLWARAMYPGWANSVEKAMIEVAYTD
ncbi:hypothetical protein I7I48_12016 [Histoplasma ohiense]|nr:hypothetical protein I7I48_12016 [Histoplasma ohiense (nom. inval.)]